jgi:hypothetical protein
MAKQNQMDVLLFDEVNKVRGCKLDAYKSHIESIKTLEAWGLNSRQQCKDEVSGKYLQFVDAKSFKPIKIYEGQDGDKGVESDVSTIASETEDEEMTLLDNEQHKNGMLLWLGIGLTGVILAFMIAILVVVTRKTPEVVHAATSFLIFIGGSI